MDGFRTLLESKLIAFEVLGDDGKPTSIQVHAQAIASLSASLDNMIYGEWKESGDGKVVLTGTSLDTFVRICQFAYTGDYDASPHLVEDECSQTADHEKLAETDASATLARHSSDKGQTDSNKKDPEGGTIVPISFGGPWIEYDDSWRERSASKRDKKKKKMTNHVLGPCGLCGNDLIDCDCVEAKPAAVPQSPKTQPTTYRRLERRFDALAPRDLADSRLFKVRANKTEKENFAPVFLGHAQVYLFASLWEVEEMRRLSLGKLYEILRGFKLFPGRVGDIVQLARLICLGDGPESELTCAEDDVLRKVVIAYIAKEIECFRKCPDFVGLAKSDAEFASDLLFALVDDII